MKQITLWPSIRQHSWRRGGQGFSLVELLVAAVAGLFVIAVAGDALLFHVRSLAVSESLQRQRESASRATSLIESEIAHSEGVITSPDNLDLTGCGLTADEFRLALKMPDGLEPVIYGVKVRSSISGADYGSPDDWNGANLLTRCGPSITIDGTYAAPTSPADSRNVIVDNLTASAQDGGFSVPHADSKSVSFLLALDGLAVSMGSPSSYLAQAGGSSHTNQPLIYPTPYSGCDEVCTLTSCTTTTGMVAGTTSADTITAAQVGANTLVCGRGGGDNITGSSSDQAIDPGRTASATVSGGGGKDVLYGSAGNDSLTGGILADILVGRNGSDTLSGGGGDDIFFPWTEATVSSATSTVISGGDGDDSVYFPGTQATFTFEAGCSQTSCTVKAGTSPTQKTVTMSSVEELMFTDGRYAVPQPLP